MGVSIAWCDPKAVRCVCSPSCETATFVADLGSCRGKFKIPKRNCPHSRQARIGETAKMMTTAPTAPQHPFPSQARRPHVRLVLCNNNDRRALLSISGTAITKTTLRGVAPTQNKALESIILDPVHRNIQPLVPPSTARDK